MTLIITDETDENDLSSRLVRLGAIQTAIAAIGTFAIGYYITWRGFTDLFWIGIALQFLCIVIALFGFGVTHSNADERTPLLSTPTNEEVVIIKDTSSTTTTTCSHFFDVCTVFNPQRRSTKKSASIFPHVMLQYLLHISRLHIRTLSLVSAQRSLLLDISEHWQLFSSRFDLLRNSQRSRHASPDIRWRQ